MLNRTDGYDLFRLMPRRTLEVIEDYEALLVYCLEKPNPRFKRDSTMPRHKLRKLKELGFLKCDSHLWWLTATGLRHARRVRQRQELNE